MGNTRLHSYDNWGKESFVLNENEQLYTAYQQADFMKIRKRIKNMISGITGLKTDFYKVFHGVIKKPKPYMIVLNQH